MLAFNRSASARAALRRASALFPSTNPIFVSIWLPKLSCQISGFKGPGKSFLTGASSSRRDSNMYWLSNDAPLDVTTAPFASIWPKSATTILKRPTGIVTLVVLVVAVAVGGGVAVSGPTLPDWRVNVNIPMAMIASALVPTAAQMPQRRLLLIFDKSSVGPGTYAQRKRGRSVRSFSISSFMRPRSSK